MNTQQDNVVDLKKRIAEESKSALDTLVQDRARRMLQAALEREVADYVATHTGLRDESGRRFVVRNGSMPERNILTGAGPLPIKQPRVHDRRAGERFTSAIPSPVYAPIPEPGSFDSALYLKGISTRDSTVTLEAFDDFVSLYEAKYPKATECLVKDKEVLFTFYDFSAPHWIHLRTTNPIESTFATVRHRTRQTKGCGSTEATTAMVYKLAREAERRWRRERLPSDYQCDEGSRVQRWGRSQTTSCINDPDRIRLSKSPSTTFGYIFYILKVLRLYNF